MRDDDADIDALLGTTIEKVGGDSQQFIEQTARLQTMLEAARDEPKKLVDPRTLPLRFSRLKQLSLSAAHYLHSCQGEVHESLALRMGAGVHAGLFEDRPLVCYDGHRAGKAWEKFEKRHKERGAVILNGREHAIAMGIVGAVRRHARAMELLFDGTTIEQTFEWTYCGRAARSTPDAYVAGVRNVDLKSTRTAELRRFARDALARHYHAQMAFYAEGLEQHTGLPVPENYLVAVENAEPHNVVVWRLPPRTLGVGARLCRQWVEQLLQAELAGVYAGYVESDVDLEIPDRDEPLLIDDAGDVVIGE